MAQTQRKSHTAYAETQKLQTELHDCAVTELNLMRHSSSSAVAESEDAAESWWLDSVEHTIPARRQIIRERDMLEAIPFVYKGWAACSATLSDGRRQILSFLLPGDIAPTSLIFEPPAKYSIEAVTEVSYGTIKRTEFKAVLFRNADLFEKFSKIWVDEKHRSDQLAIDLGRRSADERIARLILSLVNRMKKRGLANGETIEFPLRQHHIADATGLTAVHVSKVLTEFRRAGFIDINERSLTVLDPVGFYSIANMR